MQGADKYFLEVHKGLRTALRQDGFRASSQNFVLESAECWGIINLQKSRWSQPDEKTFYVNVAVTDSGCWRLMMNRQTKLQRIGNVLGIVVRNNSDASQRFNSGPFETSGLPPMHSII